MSCCCKWSTYYKEKYDLKSRNSEMLSKGACHHHYHSSFSLIFLELNFVLLLNWPCVWATPTLMMTSVFAIERNSYYITHNLHQFFPSSTKRLKHDKHWGVGWLYFKNSSTPSIIIIIIIQIWNISLIQLYKMYNEWNSQ